MNQGLRMKFNSLTIREIRGIRQFDRAPCGKNIVICGENGTGKSGVIDAIDFLLTGRMRRLAGDGSKELSLEEHGKHILANIKDAYVEADVSVGETGTLKLRRSIKSKKLEINGVSAIESAIVVDNLKDGQFALSRKELLKFIACDGSTRAQQVQTLLDIQDIDKIRVSVDKAVRFLEKEESEFDAVCNSTGGQIDRSLDLRKGSWNDRLQKINDFRQILGANEITELKGDTDFTLNVSRVSDSQKAKRGEFERLLKKQLGSGYLTSDIRHPRAMVKMDITDIQYPDNPFDVIYCSHVLEHVPDDRRALSEFYRILKPTGWAILLVPIIAEKTFEDPSITDPSERLKLFGQADHVRGY